MTTIPISDRQHYDFITQFINHDNTTLLGVKPHEHNLEVEVQNPIIARLIERICTHNSVIFPYINHTGHSWIITAPSRQQLDQTVTRLNRFIIPTYANFIEENSRPQLKSFKEGKNTLQQLGAQLYPAGYYRLQSFPQHFTVILGKIELWLNLEEECPNLHRESHSTYNSLYNAFQIAMTATNWEEAEQHIHEMQKLHLVTAENLAFLQIQLLVQQQRWHDIWQRSDFPYLARIQIPKAIRSALLTAFHAKNLLYIEEQEKWGDALDIFQKNRSSLGLLLTGRFGLTQDPVLRVFAYQATLDKDYDGLIQLQKATNNEETLRCIHYLQQTITKETEKEKTSSNTQPPLQALTPLEEARKAISEFNYDLALSFTRQIEHLPDKALLLLQIAFHSSDFSLSEEALVTYWDLPEEEQHRLEKTYSFLPNYFNYLENLTQQQTTNPEQENLSALHISTWPAWFEMIESTPEHTQIQSTLKHLLADKENVHWDLETITILKDKLFNFLFGSSISLVQQKNDVLHYFLDIFLQSLDFPQEAKSYQDIYETLYDALLEKNEVNYNIGSMLLRLAEALLQQSPLRREKIYTELSQWCPKPIPALEDWVLEALDLFAEYGISSGQLLPWYRIWVTALLDLPSDRERTHLEIWRIFGNWIKPGSDILQKIDRSLEKVRLEGVEDAIANLPSKYQIGIMTLMPEAARRAKNILLDRNNSLDIRICVEKDLNDQAKAIAQHSDMVVIVTKHITHALTYGIHPYLKRDPVYPIAGGTTGIIAAIENRAREDIK